MAEKDPEFIPEAEEEEDIMMTGQVNIRQAKDYVQGLETLINDFKKLLDDDRADTLEMTVKNMKQHMCQQFDSMRAANTDIIIACIKDPKCVYVQKALQEDIVKATDPEEEIPSGGGTTKTFPKKMIHQHSQRPYNFPVWPYY